MVTDVLGEGLRLVVEVAMFTDDEVTLIASRIDAEHAYVYERGALIEIRDLSGVAGINCNQPDTRDVLEQLR